MAQVGMPGDGTHGMATPPVSDRSPGICFDDLRRPSAITAFWTIASILLHVAAAPL